MNYEPNPRRDTYHEFADTNESELSIHHSIGEGPTEAISLVIAKKHFYTKDQSYAKTETYTKTETDAAILAAAITPTPVGVISLWGAAAAPTNYLLCDGASLDRSTYAALFAVIGTTYGTVDATHFTLPNLKGRVPVGLTSVDTEFNALGKTGGSKTHTLSTSEIPSHQHMVQGADKLKLDNAGGSHTTYVFEGGIDIGNTAATGGNGSHNNIQPYITLNYIIKAF